jgi:hypothetical protein
LLSRSTSMRASVRDSSPRPQPMNAAAMSADAQITQARKPDDPERERDHDATESSSER